MEDMRGERNMEFGGLVDAVWYQAVMKQQREKEKPERNKEEMAVLYLLQPISKIVEILNDDGNIIGKSNESEEVTRSTI